MYLLCRAEKKNRGFESWDFVRCQVLQTFLVSHYLILYHGCLSSTPVCTSLSTSDGLSIAKCHDSGRRRDYHIVVLGAGE